MQYCLPLHHAAPRRTFPPRTSHAMTHQTPPDAATLNAALMAYLHTLPQIERLRTHITAHGLQAQAQTIEAELRALIKSADDFLYAQEEGTQWDQAFSTRFHTYIAHAHPWLTREAFAAFESYGKWLSWHEGLGF
jgi:hypothetical protein